MEDYLAGASQTRPRRSSFNGTGFARTSRGSRDYGDAGAPAAGVVHGSLGAKHAEKMKETRRRASFDRMACGAGDGHLTDMLKEGLISAAGLDACCTPLAKMIAVLTSAKEKAMTADQIFKYFDTDGNGKITAIEFKAAFESLDKARFNMTDEEITALVQTFDNDGDGYVSMEEFKDFCYNKIPGVAWRAEKLRTIRSSLNDLKTERMPAIAISSSQSTTKMGTLLSARGADLAADLQAFHVSHDGHASATDAADAPAPAPDAPAPAPDSQTAAKEAKAAAKEPAPSLNASKAAAPKAAPKAAAAKAAAKVAPAPRQAAKPKAPSTPSRGAALNALPPV
ncbi:hypothetical protein M885DRAFT_532264 [Pelagophyceae sp. CCMP2097]|nr:hypothetical protein M885DRAFT_532264 [Pelagophyceae sp. CCMP2097]|mmetsp:Transcript_28752/g.96896  ORF Transcript_28752/g.96896 Transcript_28752/m.96896 type:complete len:339 (-) Transcript_28752:90-1106(-)